MNTLLKTAIVAALSLFLLLLGAPAQAQDDASDPICGDAYVRYPDQDECLTNEPPGHFGVHEGATGTTMVGNAPTITERADGSRVAIGTGRMRIRIPSTEPLNPYAPDPSIVCNGQGGWLNNECFSAAFALDESGRQVWSGRGYDEAQRARVQAALDRVLGARDEQGSRTIVHLRNVYFYTQIKDGRAVSTLDRADLDADAYRCRAYDGFTFCLEPGVSAANSWDSPDCLSTEEELDGGLRREWPRRCYH